MAGSRPRVRPIPVRGVSHARRVTAAVLAAALAVALAACGSAPPPTNGDVSSAPATQGAATPTIPASPSGPAVTPRASGDLGTVQLTVPVPDSIRKTDAYGIIPIDEVIVALEPGRGRADADALAASLGGSVTGQIDLANLFTLRVPATDETGFTALLAKIRSADGVRLAAPNQAIVAFAGENDIWGVRTSPMEDPIYSGAAGDDYKLIGVPTAWEYIRGSGMKLGPAYVGIVDTGLYTGTKKAEFSGEAQVTFTDPDSELATPSQVTYNDGTHGDDPMGSHGTGGNVLVGADPNNGNLVGIASPVGRNLHISNTNYRGARYTYGARPADADPSNPAVRQWGENGTYSFSDLAAITAELPASDHTQPKVINLSWGAADWKTTDPALARVYRDFFEQVGKDYPNVIFVAAAGNEGTSPEGDRYYPAGVPLSNVITVGNVTNDGKVWKESNTANTTTGHEFEVSIFAPGEQSVHGYDPATGTVVKDHGGTSMAAPQVTATIALLQSLDPKLTPDEIKKLLVASARKGPDGQPILAVDEAVYAVLDINCRVAGTGPCPTREEMANRGAIDAVATPLTDAAGEYLVRGIVQSVGGDGTDVTIDVQGGAVTKGETPRHLAKAGELGWTVKMDEEKGTVTVRRTDNGAGSIITLEKIDINGTWAGTFTITKLDIDPELVKAAEEEGCTAESLKDLVGKSLPMTMTIKVDKAGNGTAVTFIDMSSIKDTKGKPVSTKPSTAKIRYAGNQVTFTGDSSTAGGSMTGYVTKAGDVVSMRGTSSAKAKGYSMAATWNVVQGQ